MLSVLLPSWLALAPLCPVFASRMRAMHERPWSALLAEKQRVIQGSNASSFDSKFSSILSILVPEGEEDLGSATAAPLPSKIAALTRAMDLDAALAAAKPPKDIVNLVKAEPTKLDKKAVEKAVGVLNDKIEKAQLRLDMKMIELSEFVRKNRKTYRQVMADVVRLSAELADYDRMKVKNMAATAGAEKEGESTSEQKSSEFESFKEEESRDAPVLAMRKKDLEVAEYLLELTRCKETGSSKAASLLQGSETSSAGFGGMREEVALTGLQECSDANGTVQYEFEDPRLVNSTGQLSEQGQEMLKAVLGASQLSDANLATAAVLGAGFGLADLDDGDDTEKLSLLAEVRPPKSKNKQSKRCANAKPDCGVLHDTFAMLWGEMKDLVEELTDKMKKDSEKWKNLDDSFNDQLGELTEKEGNLGSSLGEIVGETNGALEERGKREKTAKQLQETYKKTVREGKAVIREILYTEICGVIRVRNQLLIDSLDIKEDDIIDCAVTKWSKGPCSKTCDDALVGGIQKLSREVVVKQKGYGAGCPTLAMTTKCGQFPCPVDCEVSTFSAFSKCTKQCGGGVQMRIRSLRVRPKNGGKACPPLQESRPCNSGSCDRNCKLGKWSQWSSCSQACDGGFRDKNRKVIVKARAEGTCPKYGDAQRFLRESCNTQKCVGDEICIAKADVVFAIDGSGSLTHKGFDVLKNFTIQLAHAFRNMSFGHSASTLGVVHFGNGHLEDKVVSDAEVVSPLTSDFENATAAIKSLKFSRGFTNMAQGIMKAHKLLKGSPRKDAESVLVLITDGKPSFKRQTDEAVAEYRKIGKLVIIQIKNFPTETDQQLMKQYVSSPTRGNYILIPGKKALKADYKTYLTKAMVHICSRAISPSQEHVDSMSSGFRLLYEGKVCAVWPGPNSTLQESPEACHAHAAALGKWVAFEFTTPEQPLGGSTPEQPMGAVPMGGCKVFMEECSTYLDYDRVDVYAPPLKEADDFMGDEFAEFEGFEGFEG